jgi:hypothetical protein
MRKELADGFGKELEKKNDASPYKKQYIRFTVKM